MTETEIPETVRAFGEAGQKILSGLTVAVVGGGGPGRQIAQTLALLGVGGLVLIDPDRLEASNANRVVGVSAEQMRANRARIVERGAAEGFAFGPRSHIWNTFDAHRMLFWAGAEGAPGAQRALKHALLAAYHGEGRNPGAHDVLLELAGKVGLPVERAREVLERGEYSEQVRQAERFWQELGIEGVPAVIINRKHLISGGQPHEVFEQALRQIAAEKDA
jgi:predicted DsbA family dithiol-disulfide isomerase